jgi:signal transduction histidine kinase/CheY-like chemotaxis protein
MIKHFLFYLIFLRLSAPFLVEAQNKIPQKGEGIVRADYLFKEGNELLKTNPEESIILFKEAQFIYKNQGKNAEMVNCILALAETHIRLSDYDIAYSLLTNAVSLALEYELPDQHLMALTSLSKVSSYMEEIDRAMGFIDDGIQLAEKTKKNRQKAFLLGMRAYISFYYKKDYSEANFKNILALYSICSGPKKDTLMLISASNFMGGAYQYFKKDYEKSRQYYEESVFYSRATNDLYRTSIALNNLAEMLIVSGQLQEAEAAINKSFVLARELKSKLLLYNCFRLSSKISELQGNFQLALDQYRSYEQLKQKVLNEDLIRKTREIHSLFSLERKARENDRIATERLIAEKESEKKIRTYQGIALVFLVILLSFFILFYLNRQSLNKSLAQQKIIKEQNETLKLVNKDLDNQRLAAELANKEAELAVKSKIDFFSMMTHELRTPLNAVIGIVQLLQEENPPPHQKKSLEILHFSADNLLSLVNDILDFNRIEAGKVELEKKPFSLVQLLKNIRNSLKFKADEKGLELRLRIDKDLPPAFLGDKLRLGQVFYNLISNAIKFTDHGFVEIEIRYYPNKPEANVFASVRDSGIGIPEDKQQSIFDFFSQADSSIGRKFGGSGLGLTITKNLLSLIGSQIHLESKEGRGSTFYFTLSLLETHPTFLEPETQAIENSPNQLAGAKILLVEDVDFNRVVAERFLKKWNIDFDSAKSGMEGLEMAEKKVYDLILMDIQLPDMDGFQAASEIKKIPMQRETPILAMTASPLSEVKEKMEKHGVQGYLPKPFVSQELKASISEWLGQNKKKIK